MTYFSKEYINFFKDLSQNNNKKWFDQNRKRYEVSVKTPLREFLIHAINHQEGK
jgi:uncharacterized protein (DUF2461 family)